jgi:DMSO/TMAO reductase YedYZ heme-binding membrane subunit
MKILLKVPMKIVVKQNDINAKKKLAILEYACSVLHVHAYLHDYFLHTILPNCITVVTSDGCMSIQYISLVPFT